MVAVVKGLGLPAHGWLAVWLGVGEGCSAAPAVRQPARHLLLNTLAYRAAQSVQMCAGRVPETYAWRAHGPFQS
jgi:hypothetical protein